MLFSFQYKEITNQNVFCRLAKVKNDISKRAQ